MPGFRDVVVDLFHFIGMVLVGWENVMSEGNEVRGVLLDDFVGCMWEEASKGDCICGVKG